MRVLLIEDDLDICQAIEVQLNKEGYTTDICTNGEDALFYVIHTSYDAIVLDRLLPGSDGLTIIKEIRQNNIHTPVIMATAMSQISDRIDGLDNGADDYIVKPYDVQELSARIRALTRRPAKVEDVSSLSYADLNLLVNDRELLCNDTRNQLSKRETLLLEYFLQNPEATLTREAIFSHVWGPDAEVEDGNLDNYIHFLRKRLRTLGSRACIRTLHGAGYRLETKSSKNQ